MKMIYLQQIHTHGNDFHSSFLNISLLQHYHDAFPNLKMVHIYPLFWINYSEILLKAQTFYVSLPKFDAVSLFFLASYHSFVFVCCLVVISNFCTSQSYSMFKSLYSCGNVTGDGLSPVTTSNTGLWRRWLSEISCLQYEINFCFKCTFLHIW